MLHHSTREAIRAAKALIDSVSGRPFERAELAAKASELVPLLLQIARRRETGAEREHAQRLSRMMDDPAGLALTQALTDRAFRPRSAQRVVSIARGLLRRHGIPLSLPALDRLALRTLSALGPLLPGVASAGIARRIRRETEPYLIPGEWDDFARHLRAQKQAGLRVNVNRLGEEVLSESDAQQHVTAYLELLARPEVTTISVKTSAICSRINVLAWDDTLAALQHSLRPIYRAALGDGTSPSKLVYLDMESYRDLALNLQLFRSLLDESEFRDLSAGVVLQAYIPESAPLQRELVGWARQRVKSGGAPIRLRIAKGANLGTESVEASLRGWPKPTFGSKHEVDANYKRLLEFGCRAEHAHAVRLGIASHNLFDIAYGALLRSLHQSEAQIGFELLQGMADPLCRALQHVLGDVLIYAPMVSDAEFSSAIAYLVRRFDENTAEENFLRHSFNMASTGPVFERERQKFLLACLAVESISETSKRNQDRGNDAVAESDPGAPFRNEPDTDFSRPQNRQWIEGELRAWSSNTPELSEARGHGPLVDGCDPSRPGHSAYRYALATRDDIAAMIEIAVRGLGAWSARSEQERARALLAVATQLRHRRGELIASMVLDAGKRVDEADVEVSEAIDFAEWYARSLLELSQQRPFEARGVTVVTPPWNFPLAIPLGGALAALAAGNSVILKPAPETVLVAERGARALWAAGIPRDAFQLAIADDEAASLLITDPRVATVILTGATATAKLFRSLRPGLHLCAETGGKNALIVSACADRELAIKDALSSAFGHAGQKCSAASLLILEAELYDDPHFREKLASAARDLVVGSAWDPKSFVTPLIRAPEGPLLRALHELDAGESWLVEPSASPDNPLLFTPGIKLGVQEGSFSHTTELFGPVLSVLRADNLEHALRIANATAYGLTAGLHSLDEEEQQYFLEHMNAGNLYVNRTITGAIVGRQPFGGRKASSFGLGMKAGGPNYLLQFMRPKVARATTAPEGELPAALATVVAQLSEDLSEGDRDLLRRAAHDYVRAFDEHFRHRRDPFALLGQSNVLVHQPWPLCVRVDQGASPLDVACTLLAARVATSGSANQLPLHFSAATNVSSDYSRIQAAFDLVAAPSALDELVEHLQSNGVDRVRALGHTPPALLTQLAPTAIHVASDPVTLCGRVELLYSLREQSRCITTHRYGNLRLYQAANR